MMLKNFFLQQKLLNLWLIAVVILLISLVILALVKIVRSSNRLSKAKSEFLATVSHELKTPITAIRMFTEIMESGLVTDALKLKDYYGSILCECDRLTRMIGNLLTFANLEKGAYQIRVVPINLNNVIARSLKIFSATIQDKGFAIESDLQATGGMNVSGDKDLLIQSIVNVLSNCVKYSQEKRCISISSKSMDARILLIITDQGIGISKRDQEKIFGSFYRVEQSGDSGVVPGSGIGLFLVKRHINAMGGKVFLVSEVGKGTTVTFELMRAKINQENLDGAKA